jgi:hypothetical protein
MVTQSLHALGFPGSIGRMTFDIRIGEKNKKMNEEKQD